MEVQLTGILPLAVPRSATESIETTRNEVTPRNAEGARATCVCAASQFATSPPACFFSPGTIKEPAWHRRARSQRRTSRCFLRSLLVRRIGKGLRFRLLAHLARLQSHHSWCWTEIPQPIREIVKNMTWFCRPCGAQNAQHLTHCKSCKKPWEEVWAPPRRRSKSAWNRRTKEKKESKDKSAPREKEKGPSMTADLFPDDLPWVTTTPQSRVQARQVKVSEGLTENLPLVPPAPPVIAPPVAPVAKTDSPLTEQEQKKMESLQSLKSIGVELPDNLLALLQDLEKRAKGGMQVTLSHSQINKLHKLRAQIATLTKKVQDLDTRWSSFMHTIMTRARDHGQQYQMCRAELLHSLANRQQEMKDLKQTISQASLQLTHQPEDTATQVPEMNPELMSQMEELQRLHALGQNAVILDDDNEADELDQQMEEEEEEELLEEVDPESVDATQLKPSPHTTFRVSPSPNRLTMSAFDQLDEFFAAPQPWTVLPSTKSASSAISAPSMSVRQGYPDNWLEWDPNISASPPPSLQCSSNGQWDAHEIESSDPDLWADAASQSILSCDHFLAGLQILTTCLRQHGQACLKNQAAEIPPSSKHVQFCPVVELHLWDGCRQAQAHVHAQHSYSQFRTLWHIDGQVCSNRKAIETVRNWQSYDRCPVSWGPILPRPQDLCLPCISRGPDMWQRRRDPL
eukprot:Skav202838  [mRNA]  locus=scaffold746:109495:111729:+ [translate_table: standard]